jgi:ATP synthase protein I
LTSRLVLLGIVKQFAGGLRCAMGRTAGNGWKGLRSAAMLSGMGITLVAATVIGFLIGSWLDRVFRMRDPWLTVLFVLLGAAAGFLEVFRLASRAEKEDD